MRRPHDKWMARVGRGMNPSDTTILKESLAKIRAGKAGNYGD